MQLRKNGSNPVMVCAISTCDASMCPQAARIELAAQEAKTAAGAAAVALPSPNKLPAPEQDSSSPWGVKQRSIFRSDSAARLAAQQGAQHAAVRWDCAAAEPFAETVPRRRTLRGKLC